MTGGPAAEIIATGDDGDLVRSGGGDDLALLGAGDDTAIQGPGDGFDSLEGQTGADTVRVVGTGESEEFTLQSLGTRARITRDVAPATADMAGIETADVSAGGGPDLVDLGDLQPTDLLNVVADVGVGDGAIDAVAAQGRNGTDFIDASVSGEAVSVTGLPGIQLRVENAQPDDRLTVFGLDGSDILSATGTVGGRIGVTLDGGAGGDTLLGGDAAETMRGGPGIDAVVGGRGDDRVSLGDGDDQFVHDPQSGNDVVDGDAGADLLSMTTTDADERIDVFASGGRARATSPSAGSLDLSSMDRIRVQPLKGTDNVVVGDLSGTGTQRVDVDLATADSRVDTVTVVGSAANNLKLASAGETEHVVTGLGAEVRLVNPERAEKVVIDGREGDDTIDATARRQGQDPAVHRRRPRQGPAHRLARAGRAQRRSGQRRGTHARRPRHLQVAARRRQRRRRGRGRRRLPQHVGLGREREVRRLAGRRARAPHARRRGVNLDLNDVERIDVMPAAGADSVHVADLSGTDSKVVTWELAPVRGTTATDGALDRVTVDGTNGADAIKVGAGGQQVRTTGLAATVEVNRADKTDVLTIDTKLGGDLTSVEPAARNLMTIAVL